MGGRGRAATNADRRRHKKAEEKRTFLCLPANIKPAPMVLRSVGRWSGRDGQRREVIVAGRKMPNLMRAFQR
jgi:hypothetical protein